jgi:hypothetical protein
MKIQHDFSAKLQHFGIEAKVKKYVPVHTVAELRQS